MGLSLCVFLRQAEQSIAGSFLLLGAIVIGAGSWDLTLLYYYSLIDRHSYSFSWAYLMPEKLKPLVKRISSVKNLPSRSMAK